MKIGDLVKYMSRVLLVVGFPEDPEWVECIEVGETHVGKYRFSVLEVISESR